MTRTPHYGPDLAWVYHVGFAGYAENARDGIVARLRGHGLRPGQRVLDVGCGTGVLARALLDAGYAVSGVDASPALIELAREHTPGGDFQVLALPTLRAAGTPGALPSADAIVSTGHVLNYLDSRADIARALAEIAAAVRPGGLLALDLMTERFCEARDIHAPNAKVEDDWVLVTLYSRPAPYRFDRDFTVFRRTDDGWRRSDEHHATVTFEPDEALAILRARGVDAHLRPAFGSETLPEGLVVLTGVRR